MDDIIYSNILAKDCDPPCCYCGQTLGAFGGGCPPGLTEVSNDGDFWICKQDIQITCGQSCLEVGYVGEPYGYCCSGTCSPTPCV